MAYQITLYIKDQEGEFMSFSLMNRNIHLLLKKSTFLSDLDYVNIQSEVGEGISGNCVSLTAKGALLPALGEFFEREKMNYVSEYSSICAISARNSNQKRKQFTNIGHLDFVQDSCGLASFTDSRNAFQNSLEEFVERQSLIFNYLSKSTGNIIKSTDVHFDIPNRYKKFNFWDISLVNSCFVFIGLGKFSGEFFIGLGSSTNAEIAMKRCIKELDQFFAAESFKKSSKIQVKKVGSNQNQVQDYNDLFAMLTSNELLNAYNYLFSSKNNFVYHQEHDIQEVLDDLYNKYKIDPYITFFRSPRKKLNQKIIKAFDLNWFPNMKPSSFKEEQYDFVERVTGKQLDRKCNVLPFP